MHTSDWSQIKKLPIPVTKIILSLESNYAVTGDMLITENQAVEKYQPLTKNIPNDTYAIAIHSPVTGVVRKIGFYPLLQASANVEHKTLGIEISSQDLDLTSTPELDRRQPNSIQLTKKDLLNILSQYGIVGLGGAGFPSAKKLATQHIDTLIVNAVECEQPITVDNSLIINKITEIIDGILLLNKILQPREIVIALKESMVAATEIFKTQLEKIPASNIRLATVSNKYPNGYSKTLIKLVASQDVAPSKHSSENGIICLNVATIFSINQAIHYNQPLVERIVTITGNICAPGNYCLLIGTPMSTILEAFDVDLAKVMARQHQLHIRIGGEFMGYDLFNTIDNPDILDKVDLKDYLSKLSINKTTQAITINYYTHASQVVKNLKQTAPCIKCDYCTDVCPTNLLPQQLYWHSKNITQNNNKEILAQFNVNNCIECGLCDAVCPSNLPLAAKFKYAKSLIKFDEIAKDNAHVARLRSERRAQRLEMQAAQKFKQADNIVKSTSIQKQDLLTATLARAKQKKAELSASEYNYNEKQQIS